MKIAPRITAALALAAVVAAQVLQPAQQADAASWPDVIVEKSTSTITSLGVKQRVEVKNVGTAPSGAIIVKKWCGYMGDNGLPMMVMQGSVVLPDYLPSLNPGQNNTQYVSCGVVQGKHPISTKVEVMASDEPVWMSGNNTLKVSYN